MSAVFAAVFSSVIVEARRMVRAVRVNAGVQGLHTAIGPSSKAVVIVSSQVVLLGTWAMGNGARHSRVLCEHL